MNLKPAILSVLSAVLFYCCTGTKLGDKESSGELNEKATNYLAVAKDISKEAQTALSKNLVNAINTGGTVYALEFCNTNAIPITDSMSAILNAGISRVSDKPRNPGNRANANELAYIQLLKDKVAKGEVPEAKMTETENKMVGYYPIVTNQLCLQCHGSKGTINDETFQKIHQLYPDDQATGYNENEIRGLWVIEMEK